MAMSILLWTDAFPKEDIAVQNNLGGITAKQAEKMSQAWRPLTQLPPCCPSGTIRPLSFRADR